VRASIVREAALAESARGIGLSAFLRLGEGEVANAGAERASTLADALEAVFGAAFLDGGYAAARAVIYSCLGPALQSVDAASPAKDAKTRPAGVPAGKAPQAAGLSRRRDRWRRAQAGVRGGMHRGRARAGCERARALAPRGRAARPPKTCSSCSSHERFSAAAAWRLRGVPTPASRACLNALLGEKLAIVSAKAQTTRHLLTGMLTKDDCQYLLVDLPGYQTRHPGCSIAHSIAAPSRARATAIW
jgi:hypothetical protein